MEHQIATALAIIAATGFAILFKASVIAWNTWFMYRCPALCDRIYDAYVGRPVRATILGLLNTAVVIFVVLVLLNIKPLGLLGILLFAALCAAHLGGRTAYYRFMAERLDPSVHVPPGPSALLRSGVLVEGAFLLPLLGQLLYIAVTLRCAGAFIMAVLAGWTPGTGPDSSSEGIE